MSNRRGRCAIGFLCSARQIAATVDDELLRLSRTELIVVPLDGDAIARLIESPADFDDAIARHVLDAALR